MTIIWRMSTHSIVSLMSCANMGARRNFRRGERAPKRPPSRRKRPPPQNKKKCASTVLRGLGGMLSREKINSGAPYYILDASQHERI